MFFCFFSVKVIAQPTWTFDPFGKEKKPKEYEEKVLGSERQPIRNLPGFADLLKIRLLITISILMQLIN